MEPLAKISIKSKSIFLVLLLLLSITMAACKQDDSAKVIDMSKYSSQTSDQPVSVKSVNNTLKNETLQRKIYAEAIAMASSDWQTARDNCLKISSVQRKSWCLAEVARMIAPSDVQNAKAICASINEDYYKYECFTKTALVSADVLTCDAISDVEMKSECLGIANKKCDMLEDEQEREECLDKIN